MNDRDLLEMAAKAAGIELAQPVVYSDSDGVYKVRHGWWHPLEDDGDALRLAVKLEIVPDKHADTIVPSRSAGWRSGPAHCSLWEPAGGDPYAATRRAIVRAAAEIGKAMP